MARLVRTLGPGLITGASDDDPSGIGTYSQVGSQFGFGLLWTALFTFPLMTAIQETCARIGLHTGDGLGVTLRRRFPTGVVVPSVLALVVANTVNVGADLGAIAAGGRLLLPQLPAFAFVVVAAAVVLAFQLFSTYRRLLSLFKWLTLALFAYVVTLVVVHPDVGRLVSGALIPHVQFTAGWLAALVAIFGTTISPYLFFWQASTEVGDVAPVRRRLPRRVSDYADARIDVAAGMAYSQVVMFCIVATSATILGSRGVTQVQSATQAAQALQPLAGHFASLLFALGIIGAGLLAIPVLTGSAAYAVRETFNFPGGLSERARYRPTFYAIIVTATVIGAVINLVGIDPIKALYLTAVLNGLVAPPLLVMITLAASDRRLMGDHRSGRLSRTLAWTTCVVMTAAAIGLLVTLIPR